MLFDNFTLGYTYQLTSNNYRNYRLVFFFMYNKF